MLSALLQRNWQRRRPLARLLYPLSLVYAAAVIARRGAYRFGILKRHRLPVPLVVVGNLTVGGAGKTPLVMELARQLQQHGMRPGIVSRGYGRRDGNDCLEVTFDTTAADAGDEPVLIFRRCHAPVMVGTDRVRCARELLARHDCDVVLADDGFQHFALRREVDIVVMGERGFGNGWCLPAGPLREPPGALKRADFVVVHGDKDEPAKPGDADFFMRTCINKAVRLNADGNSNSDGDTRPLKKFAGQPVHAVAGIGNPQRFFRQLAEHGLHVIPHAFPDHHAFTPADFADLAENDTVLMTEKDAVKCESWLAGEQFWAVPQQTTLDPGLAEAVLARIQTTGGAK